MGRPSKLTPSQWDELVAKASRGASITDLAKQYGVSKATVSKRVSKPAEERKQRVETVANQLLAAETSLKELSLPEQSDALRLKDNLLSTSLGLATAASNGAKIAALFSGHALNEAKKVDDADPLSSADRIKSCMVLTAAVNEASKVGMNLLAASKDAIKRAVEEPPADAKVSPDMTIEQAQRVYQDFAR